MAAPQPQPGQAQTGWASPAQAPAPTYWDSQPGGSATAPPPATRKKGNVVAGMIGGFGAIGMIVAVFMPWLRTSEEVTSGWTAAAEDSRVVLAIGAVALILSVVHLAGGRSLILKLAVIAAGVAGLVYSVIDVLSVLNVSDTLNPAIGAGLIVLPLGSLVLLLGGAVAGTKR